MSLAHVLLGLALIALGIGEAYFRKADKRVRSQRSSR